MSKFSSKEIQAQYREDVRKRTPIDENKRLEAKRLDQAHAEWLSMASWEEIEEQISGIGLQRGTPGYEEIRLLWKQAQQNLQKKRRR